MAFQIRQNEQNRLRRRNPLQLTLNITNINQESESLKSISHLENEKTYRNDGLSVGRDYLRVEGVTISRGELLPSSLEVMDVIGKGAFSTVYRASWKKKVTDPMRDDGITGTSVEKEVAIKEYSLIDSSQQRGSMLHQELRTLCKLDSPALVKLHGAFLHDDHITLVMELMNGGSLDNLFRGIKPCCHTEVNSCIPRLSPFLSESLIASISYQVLCGLDYLHSSNWRMLHRDLKPGNILFDHKTGCVKLCDFGLSSLLAENSLNTTVVGTTKYMAPERLRAKEYGRPSDMWSFGLILLECVIGEPPWKDVNSIVDLVVTVEEMTLNDWIPCNFSISKGLREIIQSCLHIYPSKWRNIGIGFCVYDLSLYSLTPSFQILQYQLKE